MWSLFPRTTAPDLLALLCCVAAALGAALEAQEQVPRFSERVTVSRMLVDARVLDRQGGPVVGLDASDFSARIDGRAVRVESATWVGDGREGEPLVGPTELPWAAPEPPGRLIVFLFQKDLEPSRIVGLMRMLIETGRMLDTFGPNDRAAVLSFDTHLKFWIDFTSDRERLHDVFSRGVLLQKPRAIGPGPFPSLARHLTQEHGRRAYSMEEALLLLGEALEALPGTKSVVLVGHGFGTLSGSSLYFRDEYGQARVALQRARASVFCLDTTEADSHTLEAGLQLVAADTGGFFARTHLFPSLAIRRLAGALRGHYVLFLEIPAALEAGEHSIDVRVGRRDAEVMAWGHFLREDR